MKDLHAGVLLKDNGGRRTGLDRRIFFARGCISEKRSGQERRISLDRRIRREDFTNLMFSFEPKRRTDEYVEFFGSVGGLFRGICFGALFWEIIIISIAFIRAS